MKRTARLAIQVAGALSAAIALFVLAASWRLSAGPVSLSFMTPMLEDSLNKLHSGQMNITLDDTILTWAGWERTLDIRVTGMRVALPGGDEIARIPEVSVSFSARALLDGTIAPSSIEFFGPELLLIREPDGSIGLGFGKSPADDDMLAGGLLQMLLREKDPAYPMSYLSRISVVAGSVVYMDTQLGITWRAPSADATIAKTINGLRGEMNLGMDIGGQTADLLLQGTFDVVSRRIDLGINFDRLNPSQLAGILADTKLGNTELAGVVDLPLSGTLTLSTSLNGKIESIGFDVTGNGGHVSFPVGLAESIGMLEVAQRLEVESISSAGRIEGDWMNLELESLDISLVPGERVFVPVGGDMHIPLKRVSLAGRYLGTQQRLEIDNSEIDLSGPVARLKLKANGVAPASFVDGKIAPGVEISLGLSGNVKGMRFEGLEQFWPAAVAPDAREWVLAHMPKGFSPHADIILSMAASENGVSISQLEGNVEGEGVTVDYLPPMPMVTNASGRATFDRDSFDIIANPGPGPDGLQLKAGKINFTRLDTPDPEAFFDLDIEGPLKSSLALIDSDPFNFAREVGIDPVAATGTAQASVKIAFPFRKDLNASHVTASASASLVDAGFGGILFGRNLSDGNLKIDVDNAALKAMGTAFLGGVPVGLLWNHDFAEGAIFRDRYELSGRIDNVLSLADMGIQVPDIIGNYLGGGAEANVSYTVFGNESGALAARVDLANVMMSVPEIGWRKDRGIPGTAVLELRMEKGIASEIPKFEISAPGLDVSGSASFDDEGTLEVLNLARATAKRMSVSGSLVPMPGGGWEVSLIGDEFDASLLWDDFLGIRQTTPDGSLDDAEFVFAGAADFRTLWFGRDRAVKDFIGTIYRDGARWKKIDMAGQVGDGETINLRLETYEDRNERRFGILSSDAGAALRALDIYDLVIGGQLRLEAIFGGTEKNAPLSGVLQVHNYALKEAPALANLVGVLSLTGVLDALQGEGLNFDILEVPFTLDHGALTLTDARTSGPSIGLTASGTADIKGKQIDVEGTVVPANAINQLLGNIPIIGKVLSGPEKGSAIFAATYSMKNEGDELKINFNPLSALAPGVLRGIFSGSAQERTITTDEGKVAQPAN